MLDIAAPLSAAPRMSPSLPASPPAPDPLAPLARAAAAGDAAALTALLTAVAPLILRVVRSVLGAHHPEVDDLVQDSLIGLARALPAFRGECKIAHFGARIAVRRTTDARRLLRERAARALEAGDPETLEPAALPDDVTRAARRRRLLRSLLDSLPGPQAEAMVLRFVLGYSLDEVATVSGAPVNTIRSRLRLAREALRHAIEERPELAELWEADS
jgi:RNA polymerase sigma factor (sigma-70 family)